MVNFSDLVPEEKHRILICCILGLACPGSKSSYPNPLYALGYSVELLEWDIVLNSVGKPVAPDIILVNRNDNHAVITECKSGQLDYNQFKRYRDVHRDDLVDWGISSEDPRKLVHDIVLVASYENSGNVQGTLARADWNYDFPALIINLVNIEKINRDFRNDKINTVFPVDINLSRPPQYLYPLGRESPDWIIMVEVFQSIVSRLYIAQSDEFEEYLIDLIKDLYPYWEQMGSSIKEKIKENVIRVIDMASKHDYLKRYISYNDEKIKFKIPNYKNTKVMQSFQRAGCDYINLLKREYTQTRLTQAWDKNKSG